MDVNGFISMVTTMTGETIALADAVAWLNECQQADLMADTLVLTSVELNASANTWTDLPADFLKVKHIELGGVDYIGQYEEMGDKLKFPVSGTFTVWHYRIPAIVAIGTDVPEAHLALHYPMVHYLIARFKFKDNDDPGDPEGIDALAEYFRIRNNVLTNLRRKATSGQVVRVIR